MKAKTVLITGCSNGSIGSGLALGFAARGLKVIAAARSASKMSALAADPNITLLEMDVQSSESTATALKTVSARTGGRLDYLVNNAGVSYRAAAVEVDDLMARHVFDVNFWGVVDMCRAFAPLVVEAKGTIVNISSLNGEGVPMPWVSIYGASKAAVTTYSETLRIEMAPFDVKVLTVIAGAVETNMNNAAAHGPTTLPSKDSIFRPAEKHIAKGAVPERMAVDRFADKLIGDVLSGATGRAWRGAFATRVWAILTFCPQIALDKLVTNNRGLELLGRK